MPLSIAQKFTYYAQYYVHFFKCMNRLLYQRPRHSYMSPTGYSIEGDCSIRVFRMVFWKIFLKVVARVRTFCGCHMKPGQSLLYSTTVLYDTTVMYATGK